MKKYFTLLFLMAISSFVSGQTMSKEEAKKPLQKGEIIIDRFGGEFRNIELNGRIYEISQKFNELGVIQAAYNYAKDKYPNKNVFLRNMMIESRYFESSGVVHCVTGVDICEKLSGDYIIKTHLNKAFDKALMNVREGSRFSIDNVTIGDITSEINKESVKDNVIDVLLDKGYKVVAKEYLERLYQEQQVQQSGIYNENTVVQENNLSAVGYFLNIKITDESLRVQVVNVSTGEYEGNATITF